MMVNHEMRYISNRRIRIFNESGWALLAKDGNIITLIYKREVVANWRIRQLAKEKRAFLKSQYIINFLSCKTLEPTTKKEQFQQISSIFSSRWSFLSPFL